MRNGILLALFLLPALAAPRASYGENRYLQHNLVSDLPGVADYVDPHLVNPWGIAISPTSPFWILNNHAGLANVYDTSGKPAALVVTIPGPSGLGPSAPTGQVFNGGNTFVLQGAKPASFLFCTEDGTISGWYSGIDGNKAVIAINNSGAGAVYKGLALGESETGSVLYAANFSAGRVDVFGGDFAPKTLAGTFTDPALPAGFAPFNIYVAAGKVFVAWAKQDGDRHDDMPGDGNGYLDVFDMSGRLLQRLVSAGRLNSPWGMAIAPDGFGDFSKDLLVGNFGDGVINAYNPLTGEFLGTLQDSGGKPIVNPGLWALQFGNGKAGGDATALYFTAGISGSGGDALESHGLFGSIQAAPVVQPDGVVNAATFQKGIAANTWVSIFGQNLAATSRAWQGSDFINGRLPAQLDGVTVTIAGMPAYISFISPGQLNVLTPAGLGTGDLQVQTSSGGLKGNALSAQSQVVAPALFVSGKYAVVTHADATLVTPDKPAQPGEVIVLYGTGFGGTDPAIVEGTVVNSPATLVRTAEVVIGGTTAEVLFQGLTSTGLYQFNVRVPAGLTAGDTAVFLQTSGFRSPEGVFTVLSAPVTAPPVAYSAQIDNFEFLPDPVNVAAGAKLTWTNKQAVQHTVVSDTGQFQSQVLAQGDAFSVNLAAPGTYAYHCSIHPFMKGRIVVK